MHATQSCSPGLLPKQRSQAINTQRQVCSARKLGVPTDLQVTPPVWGAAPAICLALRLPGTAGRLFRLLSLHFGGRIPLASLSTCRKV